MAIELLDPSHAKAYRQLMLEAYALHPEAFVSTIAQREKLPLSWWEAKLDDDLCALFGAFVDAQLVGIVALGGRPAQGHAVWLVCDSSLSRARAGGRPGAGGVVTGRARAGNQGDRADRQRQ